jgi:hypothetical protein
LNLFQKNFLAIILGDKMKKLDPESVRSYMQQPSHFRQHIINRLHAHNSRGPVFSERDLDLKTASAVLFLLSRCPGTDKVSGEPCLILNKRSANVRQAGDLCCPGGSVNPRLDTGLAKLLRLPIFPLVRWPYWPGWRKKRPREAVWLRLLLATGLRESLEEMRLNPLGLKFLGPLPPQPLVMFQRVIYPMVIWISGQTRFYPNWEVEKVVCLPVRDFFNPSMYARYRLSIETLPGAENVNTFPCFRYVKNQETEILWGATFRITMAFLNYVFGFSPPDVHSLPEIRGHLSRAYLNNA